MERATRRQEVPGLLLVAGERWHDEVGCHGKLGVHGSGSWRNQPWCCAAACALTATAGMAVRCRPRVRSDDGFGFVKRAEPKRLVREVVEVRGEVARACVEHGDPTRQGGGTLCYTGCAEPRMAAAVWRSS